MLGRRRLTATSWRAARLAVVDVETTGLDARRGELLAVGLVPVDDGRIRAAGAREWLVRPAVAPTEETVVVHGLRPADVAAAPEPDAVAPQVAAALDGRVVVAHHAWVERAFLGALLARAGARVPAPLLDTELLGRLWLLERDGRAPAGLSLDALAAALGLPADRRHRALGDALTTAQCMLALCTHLDAVRPRTLRELARADAVLHGARTYGA